MSQQVTFAKSAKDLENGLKITRHSIRKEFKLMARGYIRKPSFGKIVGAYRSQWKRFWLRLFTFGAYGSKGMGWWRNPKKATYNRWYNRTSISLYKMFGCKPSFAVCFIACLFASVFSIVVAPVDAAKAGVKAHKIKKAQKERAALTGTSSVTSASDSETATARTGDSSSEYHSESDSTPQTSSATHTPPKNINNKTLSAVRSSNSVSTATKIKKTTEKKIVATAYTAPTAEHGKEETLYYSYTYCPSFEPEPNAPEAAETEPLKEPDQNTPKSTPKHESDQYICKRMIIEGSFNCDSAVLAKLEIGTYFDLETEPDNPNDKDAVKLLYKGEKIGYIAKADKLLFVTSLKLKRNIYGVITNVITEGNFTKYEYETWFDNSKK